MVESLFNHQCEPLEILNTLHSASTSESLFSLLNQNALFCMILILLLSFEKPLLTPFLERFH